MKRLALILGFALVTAISSSAFSEPAAQGVYLDQNLQAAYDPLGLQLGTKLVYRFPIIHKPGILWESAKVDVGIKNSLSPAFDFFGAYVDIEPIAIFDIAFSAQVAGYYKSFGFGFRDLAGYDSAFDSSSIASLPSKNAIGYLLSAAPTLKFALGPIVFSDTLHANYFNVDGGEGYFYEVFANCVLAKSDVELFNDAYLLYKFDFGLMVGLNDSILGIPASGYRSHAIQAVGIYNRALNARLSLYAALTAGTYLEDRYYAGQLRVAGLAGITTKL